MKISRDELTRFIKKLFPFNYLDGDSFDLMLNNSQVVFFPAGKMIYLESSPAEFFYMIHSGQIEILKEKNHSLKQLNVLNSQFACGEDALNNNQDRLTSARALTDVVLIKISSEVVQQIRRINPAFNKKIIIMVSSYLHLVNKRFLRAEDETIFYIGQPHKSILLLKIILALITTFGIGILSIFLFNSGVLSKPGLTWMGSTLAGAGMLWIGWQYFEWSNELFLFTNKRVISQQRSLFSFETKQEISIAAIESIQAKKNMFSHLLGFGDLEVKTYTGNIRIPFVPELFEVEKIISYLSSRSKNLLGDEEKRAFEEEIRERLSINSSIGPINKSDDLDSVPNESLNIDDGLDVINPIKLDESIVYHTHWAILFSKTFIPIALLLAHAFLYLFLVLNQFTLISSIFFNVIIIINCILLICWSVYRIIDWKNDVFIITKDQLIDIDRHPFGMEEKKTASINNIQLIRYKKNGIIGLVFNYGTVFIRVGDDEFTFNNVHRPADVQESLFAAMECYHRRVTEIEGESARKKAVEWIDSYHRVANNLRAKKRSLNEENDSNHFKKNKNHNNRKKKNVNKGNNKITPPNTPPSGT
jgi:uncharacterized membrane protein YdbT with pleckstrin-like domain